MRQRRGRQGPPAVAEEVREEDALAAVKDVIAARSKDGVFIFHDAKTDTDLKLVFDERQHRRPF